VGLANYLSVGILAAAYFAMALYAAVRVLEGLVDVDGRTVNAGGELTLFRLEGLTLEQVVDRVAHEKKLQAGWINASAKSKRLHGGVALSPDEALAAASSAAGVQYSIENGQLVIR